ncbi:hypothetical protein [Candidatus Thiosymbion oneisti]|uniref:hypothetical protein n=1 Tax=Candidatus Thiosymbion oneisti TaxID=589554 RepID=UPI001060EF4A|nr:hypothetical protein [Candidatus Thiosymbion oneisti]
MEPVLSLGVNNTMVGHRLLIALLFAPFVFVLTGCPKLARIEAYNNTPTALTIEEPNLEREVKLKPSQTARFEFGSQYFKIKSDLGTLNYPRNIPRSDDNGPYSYGALRIQINPDGVIYALKTGENPPLSDFPEQPYGYPIAGFEESNMLFATCLDEIRKKRAEYSKRIANRQRPTFIPSNIDFNLCLDRLRAKKAAESRR